MSFGPSVNCPIAGQKLSSTGTVQRIHLVYSTKPIHEVQSLLIPPEYDASRLPPASNSKWFDEALPNYDIDLFDVSSFCPEVNFCFDSTPTFVSQHPCLDSPFLADEPSIFVDTVPSHATKSTSYSPNDTCDCETDVLSELLGLSFPDVDVLSYTDLMDTYPSNQSFSIETKDEKFDDIKKEAVYGSKISGDRVQKKRQSNRYAALRYRERKRLQQGSFESRLLSLRNENARLQAQLTAEYQSVDLLIDLSASLV